MNSDKKTTITTTLPLPSCWQEYAAAQATERARSYGNAAVLVCGLVCLTVIFVTLAG